MKKAVSKYSSWWPKNSPTWKMWKKNCDYVSHLGKCCHHNKSIKCLQETNKTGICNKEKLSSLLCLLHSWKVILFEPQSIRRQREEVIKAKHTHATGTAWTADRGREGGLHARWKSERLLEGIVASEDHRSGAQRSPEQREGFEGERIQYVRLIRSITQKMGKVRQVRKV